MAGGVGTGLLVIGKCFCCKFNSFVEAEALNEDAIREAQKDLQAQHMSLGCNAKIAVGTEQDVSYKIF